MLTKFWLSTTEELSADARTSHTSTYEDLRSQPHHHLGPATATAAANTQYPFTNSKVLTTLCHTTLTKLSTQQLKSLDNSADAHEAWLVHNRQLTLPHLPARPVSSPPHSLLVCVAAR
jgi:hypothetical protein